MNRFLQVDVPCSCFAAVGADFEATASIVQSHEGSHGAPWSPIYSIGEPTCLQSSHTDDLARHVHGSHLHSVEHNNH